MWKRIKKSKPHDLRDDIPGRISVPGGGPNELAGAAPALEAPEIVSPGVGVHTPGQTTHE